MKWFACFSRLTALVILIVLASCTSKNRTYTLSQLQGAWWSDPESPTADFAINGEEIWFDYDSKYHPCRIAGGDTLVYDLGPELGILRQKIVSLKDDTLILEITFYGETTRTTYRRAR